MAVAERIGNAEWCSRMRTLISNRAKSKGASLVPEGAVLGDAAESASFEIRPKHRFTHNLYVECRFCDPTRPHREHSFVRLQAQFKDAYRDHAVELCELLRANVSSEFAVRMSEQTVYVTKEQLPILPIGKPLPVIVNESSAELDQYIECALALQDAWRIAEPEIRTISAAWEPGR